MFNKFSKIVVLFVTILGSSLLQFYAQDIDERLAFQYYSSGDYEKAVLYFEKIFPTKKISNTAIVR